jgi:hypothetical protein
MNRSLKASFSSALALIGATVIVACSSAPADDASGAAADLSAAKVHASVHADCHNPQAGARHPAICFAMRRTDVVQPDLAKKNTTPSGFGPSDLASAYNIPASLAPNSTVAIVDAQDDPNAESDLAVYRSTFGLPPCTTANGCFKKVNQNGTASPLPTADSGWGGEISLDLDMVSAVCPSCKILLVEVSTADTADLGAGVNAAAKLGAAAISNSYGGSEDNTVSDADTAYYQHAGVFITASAGDSDTGASFPATGAQVTAVGGTSLTKDSSARGWSESVWNTSSSEGTGSGCSAYIAQPSFQTTSMTGCSFRAEADVSAVADPATGVAVYDTYGGASAGASGWEVYGGTSASSPIIAALFTRLGKTTETNAFSYQNNGDFYDVTSGSNGSCSGDTQICNAGAGWDGPTGNGTPNAAAISGSVTPPPPPPSDDAGAPTTDSGTGTDAAPAPDSGTSGDTCTHAVCSAGKKLKATCDSCATSVCAQDSYCCATKWDATCVSEVAQFCGAADQCN